MVTSNGPGSAQTEDTAETIAWRDTYGAAVPEATRDLMDKWVSAKLAYEARRKETATV